MGHGDLLCYELVIANHDYTGSPAGCQAGGLVNRAGVCYNHSSIRWVLQNNDCCKKEGSADGDIPRNRIIL